MKPGKAVLFIACTLDGYIAGENHDLSFLNTVDKPGDDYYGYNDFIKDIQAIIMGRTTYEWVKQNAPDFVHPKIETYVITHELPLSDERQEQHLKFYSGNLKELTARLISEGKNIFVEGGSQIIQQLLAERMINEFVIAIVPVLLGKGIPLFKPEYPYHQLKLENVRHFDTGLVMLYYTVSKE